MKNLETLKWAGLYLLLSLAATITALLIGTVGVALGGLRFIGMYSATPFSLRLALYPTTGFAVIILAIIAWWYGIAAAFFKTYFAALNAELAAALDTESLKSDILSVLDERLAEMHQEISETRRVIDRMNREDAASEFTFDED